MKIKILIPLLIGLPMFVFGVKELYQMHKFIANGENAEGIIMQMKKGPGILGKYHPLVRFQTRDGETVEFTPGNGSNPPIYEINDHVPVIYNPDYPNFAVINTFNEIWLGPIIYAGLGLLFLMSASYLWAKSEY